MKRHTTQTRRHPRQRVLEVRVMSPRIAWLGLLEFAGKITKLAGILAVLAGIGWAGWRGIQRALFNNPDFRLQVIALNPNPVIDELGVAAAAEIDLTTNPSLFDLKLKDVEHKLRRHPEIADVHVERHLPGTLAVTVVPRIPKAWLSCPSAGHAEVRRAGALLVDHGGVAYPCPARQVESATSLPIIELSPAAGKAITIGEKIRHPELEHCCLLLDSARDADAEAMQWIETVRQVNAWSLQLTTRQGTAATFGLGDHVRQINSLRAALEHAGAKGYLIDTINLIPKYNIPITLRNEATPPRAIPVSTKGAPGDSAARRDSTKAPKHH